MGILAHHMPLASGVEIAEMNYRIDKDKYEFAVGGGFVYVDGDNTVTLIVMILNHQKKSTYVELKKQRKS